MVARPTGTVTLLFSDIEGSTRLPARLGAERYAEVLELHRRLLREAFATFGGYQFGTEGTRLLSRLRMLTMRSLRLGLGSGRWRQRCGRRGCSCGAYGSAYGAAVADRVQLCGKWICIGWRGSWPLGMAARCLCLKRHGRCLTGLA